MARTFESIQTAVGTIYGRDAIHLDEIKFDHQANTVTLVGEINGHLCSRSEENREWINYSLVFYGVLGLQKVDVDFSGSWGQSNFDEVIDSKWLNDMRKNDSAAKVKPEHKHYVFATYDDVFHVVCSGYDLTIL